MFPDNKIALQLTLKRTKAFYIANFVIAPYFVSALNHEISKSVIYSLSFGEGLNKTTQECQMDLLIHIWYETDNDVKARYLGSSFFEHATAKDVSKHFKEITKSLVPTKSFQVSMDGPNINLKFYEALKQERNENLFHSLIDIGTCNLHSVLGAIRSGVETTF